MVSRRMALSSRLKYSDRTSSLEATLSSLSIATEKIGVCNKLSYCFRVIVAASADVLLCSSLCLCVVGRRENSDLTAAKYFELPLLCKND